VDVLEALATTRAIRRYRPEPIPDEDLATILWHATRAELLTRSELDKHGYKDVHIVVSGGFTAERIRGFEEAGVPVDSYGVGSSLIRGANDFTADVVMNDGKPCAKVGREYRPNPRLSPVR